LAGVYGGSEHERYYAPAARRSAGASEPLCVNGLLDHRLAPRAEPGEPGANAQAAACSSLRAWGDFSRIDRTLRTTEKLLADEATSSANSDERVKCWASFRQCGGGKNTRMTCWTTKNSGSQRE
jgi:hypothetical protein